MRASLLALVAAFALLACACTPAEATTDCRISTLVLSYSGGVIQFSPTFDMNTKTGYTATVPSSVDYVYLTAYAYASGPGIYMQYAVAAGSANPTAVGNSQLSGQQSPALTLSFGVNTVAVTESCNCALTYEIKVTRQPISYTKGDPLFAGLLGQEFQVHGVAGEVYSIISDPVMQMNSKFVFLRHGDCPVLNGRRAHACWSHPGSYLGEIGIKTCSGQKLHIASGSAKRGFEKVTLDGKNLELDEVMPLSCDRSANASATASDMGSDLLDLSSAPDYYAVRNSTHLVTVQLSNFLLQIENSDHFVNYRVRVLNWDNLPGTHGLLGQTYQKPAKPGKQIKEIEGDVDSYVIRDRNLFGDDFAFNRFTADQ